MFIRYIVNEYFCHTLYCTLYCTLHYIQYLNLYCTLYYTQYCTSYCTKKSKWFAAYLKNITLLTFFYNVLNITIYTVLNTLLCTVLYSILYKNIKVPCGTSYSLRNSFLPACKRYWAVYCLMYWTLHCKWIPFFLEPSLVYSKIYTYSVRCT